MATASKVAAHTVSAATSNAVEQEEKDALRETSRGLISKASSAMWQDDDQEGASAVEGAVDEVVVATAAAAVEAVMAAVMAALEKENGEGPAAVAEMVSEVEVDCIPEDGKKHEMVAVETAANAAAAVVVETCHSMLFISHAEWSPRTPFISFAEGEWQSGVAVLTPQRKGGCMRTSRGTPGGLMDAKAFELDELEAEAAAILAAKAEDWLVVDARMDDRKHKKRSDETSTPLHQALPCLAPPHASTPPNYDDADKEGRNIYSSQPFIVEVDTSVALELASVSEDDNVVIDDDAATAPATFSPSDTAVTYGAPAAATNFIIHPNTVATLPLAQKEELELESRSRTTSFCDEVKLVVAAL